MQRRKNNKGFTLAELLIVVAIIAVLTAIAIPVFNTQLAKSKLATDTANVRSKYAELISEDLSSDSPTYTVSLSDLQAVATKGPSTVTTSGSSIVVTLGEKSMTIPISDGVTISGGSTPTP